MRNSKVTKWEISVCLYKHSWILTCGLVCILTSQTGMCTALSHKNHIWTEFIDSSIIRLFWLQYRQKFILESGGEWRSDCIIIHFWYSLLFNNCLKNVISNIRMVLFWRPTHPIMKSSPLFEKYSADPNWFARHVASWVLAFALAKKNMFECAKSGCFKTIFTMFVATSQQY